jgi:hypothetical protein
MALTSTITKKSVTQSMNGLFNITFNLQYKNDAVVLIDQDFDHKYRTGQAPSIVYFDVLTAMKAAIQKYKDEQEILNNALLDTVVTNLNANVGV